MANRKSGFYWVRDVDLEWEIAKYSETSKLWASTYPSAERSDIDWLEINETQIERALSDDELNQLAETRINNERGEGDE